MPIVLSDLTSAMRQVAVNNLFFEALQRDWPETWQDYATVVSSTAETENYDFLQNCGEVREWIGNVIYDGVASEDYSLTNKNWVKAMLVKRTAFMDDQTGQLQMTVAQAAQVWREWKENQIAKLLENGDGTTYGAAYDGVSFFNDSHPIYEDGSTWDNSLALTLNQSNLQTAIETLLAVKRYNNSTPFGNRTGQNLILVVPSALEFTAAQLTREKVIESGTEKDNPVAGMFSYRVNRFLTDTNRWYVLETGNVVKPLIYQERQVPVLDPDQPEYVDDSNNYRYRWWARAAFGYSLPQLAVMSNPS
jgi:phage major head subunit gpT-like protein